MIYVRITYVKIIYRCSHAAGRRICEPAIKTLKMGSWRPHGSRWASIIGKNLTWDVRGATHDQRRDEAWVETPGPEVRVQLSAAETTPWINPDAALAPPSVEPEWSRHLVLEVPTTDTQRALYPGGGSSVRVQERLSFSAEARDRGWRIPAPGARDL